MFSVADKRRRICSLPRRKPRPAHVSVHVDLAIHIDYNRPRNLLAKKHPGEADIPIHADYSASHMVLCSFPSGNWKVCLHATTKICSWFACVILESLKPWFHPKCTTWWNAFISYYRRTKFAVDTRRGFWAIVYAKLTAWSTCSCSKVLCLCRSYSSWEPSWIGCGPRLRWAYSTGWKWRIFSHTYFCWRCV